MSYLDTYLGQLDAALSDPAVMELAINADGSIWLERAGQIHMTPSGLAALPARSVRDLASQIANSHRTPSRKQRLWFRQRCGIAI